MKIFFIGQRGLPALKQDSDSAAEWRAGALAERLAHDGHDVTFFSATAHTAYVQQLHSAMLRHVFSLNPQKPGGLVHLLLCYVIAWIKQPDGLHIHGWKAAALTPLARLLNRDATLVWTIDRIPSNYLLVKIVSWLANHACDVLTSPTRKLQYELLHHLNLKAVYVPDGYESPVLPDLKLQQFGLQRGHYVLALTGTSRQARWVAKALVKSRGQKKLALIQEKIPALTRLSRQFKFVRLVDARSPRAQTTLIRGAAMVIASGNGSGGDAILQAMAAGVPIVATTDPLLEETLGTTAQFVRPGDTKALAQAIHNVLSEKQEVLTKCRQARKRARHHFAWQRILPEYLALYRFPITRPVPIDSARRARFTELPA